MSPRKKSAVKPKKAMPEPSRRPKWAPGLFIGMALLFLSALYVIYQVIPGMVASSLVKAGPRNISP